MRDYNEVADEMEILEEKISQLENMECDLMEILDMEDENVTFWIIAKKLKAKLAELDNEISDL